MHALLSEPWETGWLEQPVSGKNDTYRFALAAHPGESWGGQLE